MSSALALLTGEAALTMTTTSADAREAESRRPAVHNKRAIFVVIIIVGSSLRTLHRQKGSKQQYGSLLRLDRPRIGRYRRFRWMRSQCTTLLARHHPLMRHLRN